jgi:hypothetical protein
MTEKMLNHFRDAYRIRVQQVFPHLTEREVRAAVANMPAVPEAQVRTALAQFHHWPEEQRLRQVAMMLCPEPMLKNPFTAYRGAAAEEHEL